MQLEELKIGLVEDDPVMGGSLAHAFELEGAEVLWWKTGTEALAGLPHSNRDIIICDIRLPDMGGDDVFFETSRYRAAAPFLFMTAYGDIEQAVDLLKSGGGDYVTKPFDLEDLIGRINALVPDRETRLAIGALGPSQAMLHIEQTLKRVAVTRMPVLLTGETGVGKDVCAHFLHGLASEGTAPFIAVNCAAIPEDDIEADLFGREAPEPRQGYAERAEKGTLYLDGISELSLGMQPKLLRLLEEETFQRLGGDGAVHFDARTICSTGRDLEALVAEVAFREDLLYRINVVSIEVPPLRERPDDILWLAERFLHEVSVLSGQDPKKLSAVTEERLAEYAWPGNVRELRNRIERASSLAGAAKILPDDIFPDNPEDRNFEHKIAKLSVVRDAAEKRQIELALKAHGGNTLRAAKTLGVSRTTMWEKMRKHRISSRASD